MSFVAESASAKEKIKKARMMISGMGTRDFRGVRSCHAFRASHARPSFPFNSRLDVWMERIPWRAREILPPVSKTC